MTVILKAVISGRTNQLMILGICKRKCEMNSATNVVLHYRHINKFINKLITNYK